MSSRADQPARLIVNADDYGYFPAVDRGIAELAGKGAVSAVGVLATTEHLDFSLDGLAEIDWGVHLDLSHGQPLTTAMAHYCERWEGRFSGVAAMALAVLRGRIELADIRREWAAQIERLLRIGLHLHFLNSHQHIHMLPPLFSVTCDLAHSYGIRHIRVTRPDWLGGLGVKAQLRNGAIAGLGLLNGHRIPEAMPRCIGVGQSGRLDQPYLQRLFSHLQPGHTYELICHPGHRPPEASVPPALAAFHDWEGEWQTFAGEPFRQLLRDRAIELVRYRDLTLQ